MSIVDKIRNNPHFAAGNGVLKGATATATDLPIADYDAQTAENIADQLRGCSQRDLRMIGTYEAERNNRATIVDKIAELTGEEPWSGYDEQTVDSITAALAARDDATAHEVRSYERTHKDRAGVLEATGRHASA